MGEVVEDQLDLVRGVPSEHPGDEAAGRLDYVLDAVESADDRLDDDLSPISRVGGPANIADSL